jgi:quinol monooxygenase YgiN
MITVKQDCLDAFKAATLENGETSIKEHGILRFDFVQQADDPTRFVLVEIYRSPDAQAVHRETAHYQKWRDTVAPMMAEPRVGTKYIPIFLEGIPE